MDNSNAYDGEGYPYRTPAPAVPEPAFAQPDPDLLGHALKEALKASESLGWTALSAGAEGTMAVALPVLLLAKEVRLLREAYEREALYRRSAETARPRWYGPSDDGQDE